MKIMDKLPIDEQQCVTRFTRGDHVSVKYFFKQRFTVRPWGVHHFPAPKISMRTKPSWFSAAFQYRRRLLQLSL